MGFVLALVIVGWLLAFAIGAQTGFDNEVEVETTARSSSPQPTPSTYEKAASVLQRSLDAMSQLQ